MIAGRFTERVTIQEKTSTATATGVSAVWSDVTTIYASVAILSLDAQAKYQQVLKSKATHEFRFRGVVSLDLNKRIIWNGETYKPVIPAGGTRRVFTRIAAEKV